MEESETDMLRQQLMQKNVVADCMVVHACTGSDRYKWA